MMKRSLVSILLLAGCAMQQSPASTSDVELHGKGSASFSIDTPSISGAGRVSGRVCRRPGRALRYPPHIEIDHLAADGSVREKTLAGFPYLSPRPDQRCGHYSASLAQPITAGDKVVACIASRAGECSKRP